MKVKVISILEDNYMYLVIEESTKEAVAVDAAAPKRLLEIIRKEGAALKAILTTHHHWDHARGNEELAKLYPDLRVYGADERIGALTNKVTHNEVLKFGDINVRCLFTPCHTSGHTCYFMWEDNSPDAPALFSGDTLFVGGCGRFFEGTAEQMYKNLTDVLAALPEETKVFCGHECAVRNLKFASKVEPENENVKKKLAWAKRRDDEDLPAVPSTLQEEFQYNPFLRVSSRAEVHGQDGSGGRAARSPHGKRQLQEAQRAAEPPGHAGVRVGALQPLPGEEVKRRWVAPAVSLESHWNVGSVLSRGSAVWEGVPRGALQRVASGLDESDTRGFLARGRWSVTRSESLCRSISPPAVTASRSPAV
ncbi:PREDICTED: hydroxyacylglutathione hydrolase-like protein isoform X1 [Crocodylus porosus]|uniref:hydroxyacylglutathione hydrolase-like protein isoform X1 n=1 Tax=Crocodylus porosus TaxID=8502 RepID=UPI000939255D|nr:PREDICTED: hydroxyacylglutathione hydrolase-like protein isoform X1 [Crocodylus porosus]